MTLASDLSVHCIRRQIDLTGPGHPAAINDDLLEKSHIPQPFEYTCELFSPKPHTPRQSVFESHKEAIVRLWLYSVTSQYGLVAVEIDFLHPDYDNNGDQAVAQSVIELGRLSDSV